MNLYEMVILIKKMGFRKDKWLTQEYETDNWWIQELNTPVSLHYLRSFHEVYVLEFVWRKLWKHSEDI